MKNDTITINGQTFRIEFNWNATCDFLERENIQLRDFDSLDNLSWKQVTSLIYSGVKEGARLENKPFDFSLIDFGAALNNKTVGDLLVVYKRQSQSDAMKQEASKKKWFPILR